jgi:formylmethanofuran dehydrogenase subunit E
MPAILPVKVECSRCGEPFVRMQGDLLTASDLAPPVCSPCRLSAAARTASRLLGKLMRRLPL